MPQQTLKELVVQVIIKQGAWAIVAVSLLVFFGWHLHNFAETAGVAVADYIVQSRKSGEVMSEKVSTMAGKVEDVADTVSKLADSVSDVAKAAQDNRISNAQNAELVRQNAALIKQNSEQNDMILQQIQQAYEMMGPAVKSREEQIKVLQEIKAILEKENP